MDGTSRVDISVDRRLRDWTDGLSKVMRCSAVEAAVGQLTQPELDSLWNLKPMQFTKQSGRMVKLPC